MGEDVAVAGGVFKATPGLLERFGPERVIDTPISELALAGAAFGAAATGLRPVFEIMFGDFMALAMDSLINQSAKYFYISNEQGSIPLVVRSAVGGGGRFGAMHSQIHGTWVQGIPGLKIAMPSTSAEAKGLLKGAIRDDNPVVFLEHKRLYSVKDEVIEPVEAIPLGRARVARSGGDVTIVSIGKGVRDALAAADELREDGIEAEVVDLRTLRPLDLDTVLKSVEKTNRLLAVEEGPAHRRLVDGPARRGRRGRPARPRRRLDPRHRRDPGPLLARRSRTRSCPTRARSSPRCGRGWAHPCDRVRRPRRDGRRHRPADRGRRPSRDRVEPHAREGGGAGLPIARLAARARSDCDVLFTMLTNTDGGPRGRRGVPAGAAAGHGLGDLSTIAPDASVALAERVRATGAYFLDCPVSGSPATLAAGQMSVMVGGDRAAFEHVEPVLGAIGPKVTYIGENGHAILTKVAINLALVVSVTAFAEGVALVEKAGVDRAAVVDAALKSVIASPVIGYRAPLLVDDDAVFADVDLQQKDLVLAQDLARRLGAAVPTCSAASEMLSAGARHRQRERDFIVSVHAAYSKL